MYVASTQVVQFILQKINTYLALDMHKMVRRCVFVSIHLRPMKYLPWTGSLYLNQHELGAEGENCFHQRAHHKDAWAANSQYLQHLFHGEWVVVGA